MLLEVPGRSEPLSLNHSAAEIWKLCNNKRTMADIAAKLVKKFEAPRNVICPDIELAISQLHRDGAVDMVVAR